MRRRTGLAALLALAALASLPTVALSRPAEAAVFEKGSAWPASPDGLTRIPVCINADSTAVQKDGSSIHDPNPSLDTVVGRVRDALRTNWENGTSIRFWGWIPCADMDPDTRLDAIKLRIKPDEPNSSGVGYPPGGSDRTTGFKPWGNDAQCISYDSGRARMEYRFDCAEQYGIHEIGHAIGFLHEWKNPVTPAACTTAKGENPLPSNYSRASYYIPNDTLYDWDSIMTYDDVCADVTGERFGSPTLSPVDAAAVRVMYPAPVESNTAVGVIPSQANACPPGSQVQVHLDNEDSNNNNSSTGWIGSFVVDRNATMTFCKVDGSKFGVAAKPTVGTSTYMTLKLGFACPAGSREIIRGQDTENPGPANEDWIGGPAGQNGRIAAGVVLRWCLFSPALASPTMTGFPNLGFDYGVVAPSSFAYAAATGSVYFDDEDDSNANSISVIGGSSLALAQALSSLASFDTNTRLLLASVTPRPANDDLANPTSMPGASGLISTTTRGATLQAGEPVIGPGGDRSLWYSFTAPTGGSVRIVGCGSGFSSALAVYQPSPTYPLVPVASGAPLVCPGGGAGSQATVTLTAGQTVLVQAAGANGASGPWQVSWSFTPANDDIAAAIALSGASGTTTTDNSGASRGDTDPLTVAGASMDASLWWTYSPPARGRLVLDTCGSTMDTLLGVYTGTSPLVPVATNDGGAPCTGDRVSLDVAPGTTYKILVGVKEPAVGLLPTGPVTLSWRFDPFPVVTSVTPPAGLLGSPFVVTFSQTVKGIDRLAATNLVLRRDGSTTPLPAIVTCYRPEGTTSSCSVGPVIRAEIQPANLLIAGESYVIVAGATITSFDTALALSGTETVVRAATDVGFDSPAVRYSWKKIASVLAGGGSYLSQTTPGATVTAKSKLTVTSPSTLGVLMLTGPANGKATVTIRQGNTVVLDAAVIDTYARTAATKPFEFGPFPAGRYTVSVTVLGTKRTASTGTTIGFDGFVLASSAIVDPAVITTWATVPGANGYARTQNAGDSAKLTFRGLGVKVTLVGSGDAARVRVTVDGASTDVDLPTTPGAVATVPVTGLDDVAHTVTVTLLGRTNGAGLGPAASLRGFSIE